MAIGLPDLPYPYDSLAPHMSKDTLRYHHDKHHRGYVDKLNDLLAGTKLTGRSLEEIILETAGDAGRENIFNNAAQCWNHTFFWNCMAPDGSDSPNGELARQIDNDLGGLDSFLKDFQTAAVKQFGSGWAWLVLDGGRLKITTTPNAVPPIIHGQLPLLTCDVWEHAYYLDYQNRRAKFVETFLKKLVNWTFVAEQFILQGEGSSTASRRHQDARRDSARSEARKTGTG
jgi:superoxide dismutase, Fe-Mn family